MITEKDFNPELLNTMLEQHKSILIDFSNSFLETFGAYISKDELLKRINNLEYIGFERENQIDESCGESDAKFISSTQKISISKRHKNSNNNIIKSLLYHELIHAISYHREKNMDSYYNQYSLPRTGLNRMSVEFEFDIPFEEGELLEEIMTEYYNIILLKKEGIDFNGIYTLNNNCFSNDYVEYHGTGYYNIVALGQIYDFLFGEELLKAKFHDGNNFRKNFNDIFDNTNIFDNCFNDKAYKVPSYSKFVAQRDVMDRYRTACKIFIELFKMKHKDNINSIDDLFKNSDFNTFLNMLVKTRFRFEEKTYVNNELFLLTKELEKNLASELFNNKIEKEKYGVMTNDVEMSIFLVLEKLYSENDSINLNDIEYSVFYNDHFKGIYLINGDEKYIIDFRTAGQNICYGKFKKISDTFNEQEIEEYFGSYNMDLSEAEYVDIMNPAYRKLFMLKDGKLYNSYGEEIVIEKFNKYSVDTSFKEKYTK